MVKLMLFSLLLVALAGIIWVSLLAYQRHARDRPPPPEASNTVWAEYYTRIARSARQSGNTDSADEYESLAKTYKGLDD